jgi:hypothetical protein
MDLSRNGVGAGDDARGAHPGNLAQGVFQLRKRGAGLASGNCLSTRGRETADCELFAARGQTLGFAVPHASGGPTPGFRWRSHAARGPGVYPYPRPGEPRRASNDIATETRVKQDV